MCIWPIIAALIIGVFIGMLTLALCHQAQENDDDFPAVGEESNHPVSQEIKESSHG